MANEREYEFVVSGTAENVGIDKKGSYDFLFVDVDGEEYSDFASAGPEDNPIENIEDGDEVNIYSYENKGYTNTAIRHVDHDDIGGEEKPKKKRAAKSRKASSRSSGSSSRNESSGSRKGGTQKKATHTRKSSGGSNSEADRFRLRAERKLDNLNMAISAARTAAIQMIPLMVEMGAIPATKVKSTMKNNKGEAFVLALIEHYTRMNLQMQMRVASSPTEEFDFEDILADIKELPYFEDEE